MNEVYCPYKREWLALRANRKRCPHCGALLSVGHQVREAEAQTGAEAKDI